MDNLIAYKAEQGKVIYANSAAAGLINLTSNKPSLPRASSSGRRRKAFWLPQAENFLYGAFKIGICEFGLPSIALKAY